MRWIQCRFVVRINRQLQHGQHLKKKCQFWEPTRGRRWVGLLRRAEDKRQAVHQQLSQCQLGRDSECVRKTPHGVETRSHSRETFWSPCLRRGFLFASRYPQTRWTYLQLRASKRLKSTTASASRHKKTRCDAHIGPGDGGTDNMAQLLATA